MAEPQSYEPEKLTAGVWCDGLRITEKEESFGVT